MLPPLRFSVLAFSLLGTFLIASTVACDASRATDAAGKTLVVCTTAMVGDVATHIAADDADVRVLFGPDVDPHLFRPSRDDVALLMRADLVLHNGLGLEGYVDETFQRVAETGTPVVAVAEEAIPTELLLDEAGASDPHVWMNPLLWARTAEVVAEALTGVLPDAEGAFDQRAAELREQYRALDTKFDAALATIDEDRRVLVTAHDAFGYFGSRYGLRVEAIQGLSTASEASLHAVEELVDLVVVSGVPAVFFESTVSERNVRALIEGAAARDHVVSIGGVLHADAPGDARTYVGMLEHNVETIAAALGTETTAEEPTGAPAGEARR